MVFVVYFMMLYMMIMLMVYSGIVIWGNLHFISLVFIAFYSYHVVSSMFSNFCYDFLLLTTLKIPLRYNFSSSFYSYYPWQLSMMKIILTEITHFYSFLNDYPSAIHSIVIWLPFALTDIMPYKFLLSLYTLKFHIQSILKQPLLHYTFGKHLRRIPSH